VRNAGKSACRLHCTFSNRPLACHCSLRRFASSMACWRSAFPTSTSISRLSASCIRCSARSSSASGLVPGTSSMRLADNGAPSRHCQPAKARTASRTIRKKRGNRRSVGKVVTLRIAQGWHALAVEHLQQGAVALGFQQFDALHQGAAIDIDLLEHLLQQQRARDQRQLPCACIALELQLEIALQTAAVALQNGEEQT